MSKLTGKQVQSAKTLRKIGPDAWKKKKNRKMVLKLERYVKG